MWAASSSSEVTSGGVRTCALEDREIDLDLIQPAGVDGKMHGHQVVVGILQAPDGGTPAVGATVVEHPKDMARGAIRFLGHDLTDEPAEWLDAGSQLQASEEFGPVDVPGRDVGQRAAPFVLMLDQHRVPRVGGDRRVAPDAGLDGCLLVRGDHEPIGLEFLALELERSSTRAALSSKSGARGKIQLRWVQGLIASSSSQRQMVMSEIEATSPRRITSAWMLGTCRREKGSPRRAGSSHAMALTATTSSGGKNRAAARAGALLETG